MQDIPMWLSTSQARLVEQSDRPSSPPSVNSTPAGDVYSGMNSELPVTVFGGLRESEAAFLDPGGEQVPKTVLDP